MVPDPGTSGWTSPGCYQMYGSEEAAMSTHTTVQVLGRARRQRSRAVRPGANPATKAGRPRKVIRDG